MSTKRDEQYNDDMSDKDLAALVIGNKKNKSYELVTASTIENNIMRKVDEKAMRVIIWGVKGKNPTDTTFMKNIIILNEGDVFALAEGAESAKPKNTFERNKIYQTKEKRVNVNLPETMFDPKKDILKLDSLSKVDSVIIDSMPSQFSNTLTKLKPLTSDDVGPHSESSVYTMQNVLQAFGMKEGTRLRKYVTAK